MRRIDRLLGRTEVRHAPQLIGSFDDWLSATSFSFGGSQFTVPSLGQSFTAQVQGVHRRNGTVAAAITARGSLMSQVLPVWENIARSSATYGDLFGTRDLALFESPASVTREHLFAQVEVHVAFAGNAYLRRTSSGIELLRPDLIDLVYAGPDDEFGPSTSVVGYRYWPNGRNEDSVGLPLDEVAHFAPEPMGDNPYLGESWVSAVLREVAISEKANAHLESFFENGATPRTIVQPAKEMTAAQVGEFQTMFEEKNKGATNAYKTWFIGGGSDVTVVGTSLSDLDLRHIDGGIETAIAVRSRVPASVLGIREGMQGSALNAGNYTATRRLWADSWFSPYAQGFCAALETLVPTPDATRLTFDPDRVLFLQEDRKDAAEILSLRAVAARQLVDAGFDPQSVVDAVRTDNLSRLEHTGLTSVQLLPPGEAGGTEDD